MKYLKSLKGYLFRLMVFLILFALMLLFYLFTMLVFYKFHGEGAILLLALKNYGLFLLYSLPLIVIFASSFYFAFMGSDKKFTMMMVLLVSAVNTVVLLVFFLVKIDFTTLERPMQMFFYPEIRQGVINSVKDYKIYVDKMDRNVINRGILFTRNAYILGGGNVARDTVYLNTYQVLGENGLVNQSTGFSIPRKEPVLQVQETGVSRFLFQGYINYIKKLRGIFYNTFATNGIAFSALAILLLCIGFFGVASGVVVYFNEKQIMALSYASLAIVAVLLFLSFPYFLSLIALIKFGIKNAFFKVVLPSLFVGGLTALIGYGLLELRQGILKRGGNR